MVAVYHSAAERVTVFLNQVQRERKRKMTFQVGLFGSDGMLLAGDTLGSSTAYTTVQSKFIYDPDMALVVAQCGTQVAMRVARALVDKKWNGDRAKGEEIASGIWKEENKGVDVPLPQQVTQSLIAVQPAERKMAQFLLRSAPVVSIHNAGKLVSGVEYTQASLILERYYSPSLPLCKLRKLAALAVWLTGQFIPHLVGGLEIFEFLDGKTPRIVAPDEISDLLAWSENADSKIGVLLTSD